MNWNGSHGQKIKVIGTFPGGSSGGVMVPVVLDGICLSRNFRNLLSQSCWGTLFECHDSLFVQFWMGCMTMIRTCKNGNTKHHRFRHMYPLEIPWQWQIPRVCKCISHCVWRNFIVVFAFRRVGSQNLIILITVDRWTPAPPGILNNMWTTFEGVLIQWLEMLELLEISKVNWED